MKVSFSTLACPTSSLDAAIEQAQTLGFDGIELRFVSGSDRLWELAEFTGAGLRESRDRLASAGLAIPCVDTSCFFHYTDAPLRAQSLEMGRHMVDLAAALGAPGVRVFGDRVQAGANLDSTTAWVAEGICQLAEFAQPAGVEIWLESHGDFARSSETIRVLQLSGRPNTGVLWDPLNAYSEFAEEPAGGWRELGPAIRHVHIKDGCRLQDAPSSKPWDPVFPGNGDFPASSLVELLRRHGYQRFISLEWEKRWHPEIPPPEIALPRFMAWYRATLSA
jgi:sugar phosphate isomerase/epimerase